MVRHQKSFVELMFINSELYEACPASCNHTGAKTGPNTHSHAGPNTHRHAGLSRHCRHPSLISYQPSSLLKLICNMSKCIWQCQKSEAFCLFFVFKVLRFLLTIGSSERVDNDLDFSLKHLLAQKVFGFGMTWQIDLFHNVLSSFALGQRQWGSARGHPACVQQTRDNSTKLQQQGGHTTQNTHPCQGPYSGRSLWQHSHTSCFHTVHSPSVLCFYRWGRNVPPMWESRTALSRASSSTACFTWFTSSPNCPPHPPPPGLLVLLTVLYPHPHFFRKQTNHHYIKDT